MADNTLSDRTSPDIFAHVADFTLHRAAADFPDQTFEAAALMLLDTLGITIGAGPTETGRIARDGAVARFGTDQPDSSARMLFDGRRASLAGTGFAAATQTDNLDGHDGYNPTKGHIGVVVVPALAALSETVADFSGREALATVTVGYEIAGRAGISLDDTVSEYHSSGAWNALGMVAMAARMRGMSAEQMRQAMGIAEYHGPRSQMMREIAGPTMLHDGSGWGWRKETLAWMHLSGPHLGGLMAKICPVNLSQRAFADDPIAQTRVGYVEAINFRDTRNGASGFSVLFDIAATAFFANAVATAAQEFI